MKRVAIIFYFVLLSSCLLAQTSNIGIGITNPTLARLQVNGVGGSGTTSAIFGGDGAGISFQRNTPVIGFNQYRDNLSGNGRYMATGFAATQTFDQSTGSMYFDMYPAGVAGALLPSGNRSITFSNSANTGIRADPSPYATLFVPKAGNIATVTFGGTLYNSHFCFGATENTYICGGKSGSRVLINDNNPGNILLGGTNTLVGINTSSPVATLDIRQVSGKGLILIDANNFNNYEYHVGFYESAPTASDLKLYYNESLVGFYSALYGWYSPSTSDRRIKTNITPLPSVLAKLRMLQPKEYEMKDFNDNHERTFGFIAQEMNKLYPSFVKIQSVTVDSANHIPDLYSLNYDGFDIIAIKALQEQYGQLKTLEEKNISLIRRLEELERTVDKK